MKTINQDSQALSGGLLILCTASVNEQAQRIEFTPSRLHNPGQAPGQDWRGIKLSSPTPFYLETKDKAAFDQLSEQYKDGHEYGMQVGPVAANITSAGGDNKR